MHRRGVSVITWPVYLLDISFRFAPKLPQKLFESAWRFLRKLCLRRTNKNGTHKCGCSFLKSAPSRSFGCYTTSIPFGHISSLSLPIWLKSFSNPDERHVSVFLSAHAIKNARLKSRAVFYKACAEQDSNLRRHKSFGLQPNAIDHSAIDASDTYFVFFNPGHN